MLHSPETKTSSTIVFVGMKIRCIMLRDEGNIRIRIRRQDSDGDGGAGEKKERKTKPVVGCRQERLVRENCQGSMRKTELNGRVS